MTRAAHALDPHILVSGAPAPRLCELLRGAHRVPCPLDRGLISAASRLPARVARSNRGPVLRVAVRASAAVLVAKPPPRNSERSDASWRIPPGCSAKRWQLRARSVRGLWRCAGP